MNLLAFTPCCVDYYPQLQKSFMGGNSLNQASAWKKLAPNAHVSVITCLGTDDNGKMIYQYLQHIGVEMERVYVRSGATASNQLRVDEQGERFGIEGTWKGGLYETFLLAQQDWEFVARQDIVAVPANNPNFAEMLARKQKGQILSVDYLDSENQLPIEASIARTDIAFITGRIEQLEYYKALANTCGVLLVVTLGANGSYAFLGNDWWFQPAIAVQRVVDTTGCGDAYQAAFALTYAQTGSIPKAMFEGAQAASLILQAWGGVGFVL